MKCHRRDRALGPGFIAGECTPKCPQRQSLAWAAPPDSNSWNTAWMSPRAFMRTSGCLKAVPAEHFSLQQEAPLLPHQQIMENKFWSCNGEHRIPDGVGDAH